ncbi:MAG: Fe(3+) ABC transporter substrate-binding protein [Rickettsiales bacterium]|nr:Fe(3+) ABC transporter substrate-binding protein [Rickettsiales bacterium]
MKPLSLFSFVFFLLYSFVLSAFPAAAKENVVNIYSDAQEPLVRPILDQFTKDTGIQVNMVTAEKGMLLTRLELEGDLTPADMVLTVDVGNLWRAKHGGLLQAVKLTNADAQTPSTVRDSEGYWYGMTTRARVIYYNKTKVKPEELSTYEALADPKWKGALLVRSSENVYNQSLTASIILADGREKALAWAKGIVANLARTPQGADEDQLKALGAGEGKIAIANSYYFGKLLNSPEPADRKLMENVALFFPNQKDRGTHINIRGAGVTAHAQHKENAVKLLEYFLSDNGQSFFAESNFEYPVKVGIPIPKTVAAWGPFKADPVALEKVGALNPDAVKLLGEAGWK